MHKSLKNPGIFSDSLLDPDYIDMGDIDESNTIREYLVLYYLPNKNHKSLKETEKKFILIIFLHFSGNPDIYIYIYIVWLIKGLQNEFLSRTIILSLKYERFTKI